jgi:hypothetical protein
LLRHGRGQAYPAGSAAGSRLSSELCSAARPVRYQVAQEDRRGIAERDLLLRAGDLLAREDRPVTAERDLLLRAGDLLAREDRPVTAERDLLLRAGDLLA